MPVRDWGRTGVLAAADARGGEVAFERFQVMLPTFFGYRPKPRSVSARRVGVLSLNRPMQVGQNASTRRSMQPLSQSLLRSSGS
jgi:hypothetical protein